MDWDTGDFFFEQNQWTPQKRPRLEGSLSPRPIETTPPSVTPVEAERPLIPNDMPVDYRLLLLSLAEQYISEARRQAVFIAYRQQDANVEAYSKLLATGLGYYATVLQKKHKLDLSPRQEASIQLRYASVMFEATENTEEVESLLSRAVCKSVSMFSCYSALANYRTRYRLVNGLVNLKYSMQHLLARVMLKSNPKAALKHLDGLANGVAISNHTPWVYAFRFLGASLAFQLNGLQDINSSLQHLRSISDLARQTGDWAILATSGAIETAVHLRARNVDFRSDAQTAIASARAALMNDKDNQLEWLQFLVEYLDLACSLDPLELGTAKEKVDRVIRLRSQLQESLNTTEGGDNLATVSVPIQSSSPSNTLTVNTGGIFTKDVAGIDHLNFSWLSKRERLSLYFSLVPLYVQSHRNQGIQHLEDAVQWFQRAPRHTGLATDLAAESKRAQWNALSKCHVLLLLVVQSCEDSQFERAETWYQQLTHSMNDPVVGDNEDMQHLTQYVNAVVLHVTGHLVEALKAYEIIPFEKSLPDPNSSKGSHVVRELAVLSRLNALLIIRQPSHPSHHLLPILLGSLKLYFSEPTTTISVSQNRSLGAAYEFLNTILSTDAIIDTKVHLQRCLKMAKDSANLQLIAMGTSYLYSFMFKGIVGDKSLQYARSSLTTAKSAKSKTLQCVTSGLVADALDLEGRSDEAKSVRQQGAELIPWLPEPLQHT